MTRRAAEPTPGIVSPLLDAQDVMAILRVKRSFITEHAAELGAIRVGNRLRFERASIDAYLARQRIVEAAPEPERTQLRVLSTAGLGAMNPVTRLPWSVTK